MTEHSSKDIILESLLTIETVIQNDLGIDNQTKINVSNWLNIYKTVGIDATDKLLIHGKKAIQGYIDSIITTSISKLSIALSSLISIVAGVLIVSVGLIFIAIAFSLFVGELVENLALGFLISGALWALLLFAVVKLFFTKEKIESYFLRHFKKP